MGLKFVTNIILICLISLLPLKGYGAEKPAITAIEKPVGRDAPFLDKGPAPEMAAMPIIQKLENGILRFDNMTINKQEGYVRVNGEINMDEGLVEYLACGPYGKLHESILKLDVVPYYLQIALLLIDLEPGNNPLEFQGQQRAPKGDLVELWISWEGKNKIKVGCRAEDLIFNNKTKNKMQHTHWIFTGSQILDGRFMADVEQSIAATYHDPFAMFDHPLETGSDDTIYFVNKEVVPPKGTPITFEIRPLPPLKAIKK
ncbi:MAG: hypothetical protein JW786_03735 [Desulfobacterales bacterium]|nr:hypothetical protein [Desulfobacterales bacterium]